MGYRRVRCSGAVRGLSTRCVTRAEFATPAIGLRTNRRKRSTLDCRSLWQLAGRPVGLLASSMSRFDAAFYKRFYLDPRTRVTTREEMTLRANAIAAVVQHLELPVKRILDAGCGLGLMRKPLLRAWPAASYTGLEVSAHLCERFGWHQASLAQFKTRGQFDLVICYDVLQYLSDDEARSAMANLARLTRGALYFHAPTHEDWRDNADKSCSDSNIHLRRAAWYRSRLARSFQHVGFGIYMRKTATFVQWELERPTPLPAHKKSN